MNKLKKLFLTVLGAILFVCMGVAIAACGGSKTKTYTVTTEYVAAEGTVTLSPAADDDKYEEGTDVTVTVTPKTDYEVDTFTVSTDANAKLTEGKYTFKVSADTTITATFKAKTPADFLDGKKVFSLKGQWGFSFANGKATVVAPWDVEPLDYAITAENVATINAPEEGDEDLTLTKNADGSLTLLQHDGDEEQEDVFHFVGQELTVAVEEGGQDVNVVFTIADIALADDGTGEQEVVVTYGENFKYGDKVCTLSEEEYSGGFVLLYDDGDTSYKVTVDLVEGTAETERAAVTLYTENKDYCLEVSLGSLTRFADLYKKNANGEYVLVNEDSARQNSDHSWKVEAISGDVLTTYTITVTGAVWGDEASKDNYTNAKINVATAEQPIKLLTAKDGEVEYSILFYVDGTDLTAKEIKKGEDYIYDPENFKTGTFVPATGEVSFVANTNIVLKYTYTEQVYDETTYGSKTYTCTCTFTLSGASIQALTMTVTVEKAMSKIVYGVTPYESVTILYGDNGVPTGISQVVQLIPGEPQIVYTGTSSVEAQSGEANTYIITFTPGEGDPIQFKVVGTGPNFTVTVYEESGQGGGDDTDLPEGDLYKAEVAVDAEFGDSFSFTQVVFDESTDTLYVWGTINGTAVSGEEIKMERGLFVDYTDTESDLLSAYYSLTIGYGEYHVAVFDDGRLIFCNFTGMRIDDNVYRLESGSEGGGDEGGDAEQPVGEVYIAETPVEFSTSAGDNVSLTKLQFDGSGKLYVWGTVNGTEIKGKGYETTEADYDYWPEDSGLMGYYGVNIEGVSLSVGYYMIDGCLKLFDDLDRLISGVFMLEGSQGGGQGGDEGGGEGETGSGILDGKVLYSFSLATIITFENGEAILSQGGKEQNYGKYETSDTGFTVPTANFTFTYNTDGPWRWKGLSFTLLEWSMKLPSQATPRKAMSKQSTSNLRSQTLNTMRTT